MKKVSVPIYDPLLPYDDNFESGPFGEFANKTVYPNTGVPQYEFLGQKIYSPIGIPAGPLLNSNYVKAAFRKGFDIAVYKTQRSGTFPVNAFPNVLFVDIKGNLTMKKATKPLVGSLYTNKRPDEYSITNSFAMPSRSPSFWVDDLKKAIKCAEKGQLLIMSVVGTIKKDFSTEDYYDDFAHAAALAKKTGVKIIEVNLSCPNVANEGVICYSPVAVEAICKKVRAKIGNTPMIVKLGYFQKDQQKLLEVIVAKMAPYINAISAINTIPAPVVDGNGNQALPGPNRLKAGICGASIRWAGIDMVARLARLKKKKGYRYEISGVGGVMNPADYFEYRRAGADVVMSATGAMWNANLAREIKAARKKL